MSKKYYYDENKPILVSNETCILTDKTFQSNNIIYGLDSIKDFYGRIDTQNNVNIVDIGAQSGSYTLYAKYLPNSIFLCF